MDYITDLHDMCETLSKELADANNKVRQNGGSLSGADLDYVDKLTHAIKSIKTTIAMMESEDGYPGRMYPYYGNSYRGGYSRARRDSMGRYSGNYGYSRDDGMISDLHEIMREAPNDRTKQEIQKLIDKLESMA